MWYTHVQWRFFMPKCGDGWHLRADMYPRHHVLLWLIDLMTRQWFLLPTLFLLFWFEFPLSQFKITEYPTQPCSDRGRLLTQNKFLIKHSRARTAIYVVLFERLEKTFTVLPIKRQCTDHNLVRYNESSIEFKLGKSLFLLPELTQNYHNAMKEDFFVKKSKYLSIKHINPFESWAEGLDNVHLVSLIASHGHKTRCIQYPSKYRPFKNKVC